MSKQFTLIVILQNQLVRIDVAGRGRLQVKEVHRRDRFESESLAGLTDSALRLGPKRTGDVWVLSGDLWTGVVPVASDVVGMLNGEELEQALALEAENYSGIPAFESKTGARKLPPDAKGNHRWWVTQVPNSQWHEVKRTVEQFGGRWGGMAHPALARPPQELQETETWRLIQSFSDTTVAVLGRSQDVIDVLSLGNITTQRTRSQLADWQEDTRADEETVSWVSDGTMPDPLVATQDWHLDWSVASDNLLAHWAITAVTAVTAKQGDRQNELPGIAAEVPPMSNERAMLISMALAAVVAFACFGLHTLADKNLSAITVQSDRIEKQRKDIAAEKRTLKDSVKVLRQKLTALQARNRSFDENLSKATRIRQFGRKRWLRMLTALAQSHGECWVREINGDHQSAVVHGVALVVGDVTEFATRLEQLASPHGWRVHPARTEASDLSLVQFQIRMDITNDAPQVKSSPASKGNLVKK